MTVILPALDGIPDSYYAVHHPDDPGTITYWRRKRTTTTDALTAWPAKAWYGPPIPLRRDVPADPAERDAFVADWSARSLAFLDVVIDAIKADPLAAARRFADFTIRCCQCGRALKDGTSKTYGIGPECRSGMDPALLARYLTPQVGRIHAEHLATDQAGEDA
ncbi:DUF6011 domain-containing protein [Embleya sp. NPDC001921]